MLEVGHAERLLSQLRDAAQPLAAVGLADAEEGSVVHLEGGALADDLLQFAIGEGLLADAFHRSADGQPLEVGQSERLVGYVLYLVADDERVDIAADKGEAAYLADVVAKGYLAEMPLVVEGVLADIGDQVLLSLVGNGRGDVQHHVADSPACVPDDMCLAIVVQAIFNVADGHKLGIVGGAEARDDVGDGAEHRQHRGLVVAVVMTAPAVVEMEIVLRGIAVAHQGVAVLVGISWIARVGKGAQLVQLLLHHVHQCVGVLGGRLLPFLVVEVIGYLIGCPARRTAIRPVILRTHRLADVRHQLGDGLRLSGVVAQRIVVHHVVPIVDMTRDVLARKLLADRVEQTAIRLMGPLVVVHDLRERRRHTARRGMAAIFRRVVASGHGTKVVIRCPLVPRGSEQRSYDNRTEVY